MLRLTSIFFAGVIASSLGACVYNQTPSTFLPSQAMTGGPANYPTGTPVATPVPGTLYVNPAIDLGPISPLIYGSNYGPWIALPYKMLPDAFKSGITILRFPAGSWGDQNDVQSYEIDTLMGILQKMNASALFNVRLENGTPAQAAALVKYVNMDRQYHVRYWAIGNEPNLYGAALKLPYDTPQFNKDWRAMALAMKAVDPSIKLVGPEISQYTEQPVQNPKDSSGLDWMSEFLKVNGDLVDIVSFHRYPYPHGNTAPPATIGELHQNTYEWDKIIAALRDEIHLTTGHDLPIAITEFNSHYTKVTGGEATPDSFYNAVWMADVLGRMMKSRVFMAGQWMLAAQADQGGWGLIGNGGLSPGYYVYQLYKMFGDEQIYSSSDDPDVSIYAAKRADGTLTVIIINLSSSAKTKPIRIERGAQPQAHAWLLDPTHDAADIGIRDLSNGLRIPPQSMTLYVLPP
jgi:Glycosyl hydrolases family 39